LLPSFHFSSFIETLIPFGADTLTVRGVQIGMGGSQSKRTRYVKGVGVMVGVGVGVGGVHVGVRVRVGVGEVAGVAVAGGDHLSGMGVGAT
jgi:hypothetical protein